MRLIGCVLALLLAGCATPGVEELSTPQERAQAARVITLLRAGDAAGVRALSASAGEAPPAELITRIAAITPKAGEVTLVSVGSETVSINGRTRVRKAFNYEVGAGRDWALVQMVLETSRRPAVLLGLQVFPYSVRPSLANDLQQPARTAAHYIWASAMVLAIATCLTGAIVALRSPRFRRGRWLWVLASLVGVGGFMLDWTSGEISFQPIYLLLFGASAFRSGVFAPWVMTFAIPVGALVVLLMQKRYATGAGASGTP